MSPSEPGEARTPIPVSVLTGFLGSGKTTLLNALLKDAALANTAVILNEFGEIGLDHLLVETADEGIVELSSGCLCCTIRGDLINTLEGLLRKRDNHRIKPFDRVVIETTGLADPAPVLHTIMAHPYLVLRYRLDGVITTVDAVNGAATLNAHEESVKQAAVADRVVLTKTDLMEAAAAALAALKARLSALNPAAPILDAAKGEARAARLFEAGLYNPATKHPDVARWLAEEAYQAGHGREHDHARDDVNRHDEHIRAFTVAIDEAVSLSALEMFLDLLRGMHGPNLLRLKGVVRLKDDPDRPLVVHGVQHVFHPPVRLDAWPDADRRTRMVLITRDVERDKVMGLLEALAGQPKVDTASPDVLADNPLSLRRDR
ncbi:MAG: GTP-binding protein [Hyphomicrobiales bacterium]|nr:GTP-binding protein [Hyphomicrobiales bacterium]